MARARQLLLSWEAGLIVLIVLIAVVGQAADHDLISSFNIQNTTLNNVILLCLALGVAPVIVTGDIDLSIVGTLALSGVVMGDLMSHHWEVWLAISIGMVIALLCGLINGLIVVLFDLPALAVTLGTMGAYTGISFLILGGLAITTFPNVVVSLGSSNLTGTQIPFSAVVVLGVALIMGYLVHFTTWGKSLFAVGGSRKAALFS